MLSATNLIETLAARAHTHSGRLLDHLALALPKSVMLSVSDMAQDEQRINGFAQQQGIGLGGDVRGVVGFFQFAESSPDGKGSSRTRTS